MQYNWLTDIPPPLSASITKLYGQLEQGILESSSESEVNLILWFQNDLLKLSHLARNIYTNPLSPADKTKLEQLKRRFLLLIRRINDVHKISKWSNTQLISAITQNLYETIDFILSEIDQLT